MYVVIQDSIESELLLHVRAVSVSDGFDRELGAEPPLEVLIARQQRIIPFVVVRCGLECSFWAFPDGTKLYAVDPLIGRPLRGACPVCGAGSP